MYTRRLLTLFALLYITAVLAVPVANPDDTSEGSGDTDAAVREITRSEPAVEDNSPAGRTTSSSGDRPAFGFSFVNTPRNTNSNDQSGGQDVDNYNFDIRIDSGINVTTITG